MIRTTNGIHGSSERVPESRVNHNEATLKIAHVQSGELLKLLTSRMQQEKAFCSASTKEENNPYAVAGYPPVLDTISMTACEDAGSQTSSDAYEQWTPVSALDLVDRLRRQVGAARFQVLPGAGAPDLSVPVRLRLDRGILGRSHDSPESPALRKIRINMEMNERDIGPTLVEALLDALVSVEGIHYTLLVVTAPPYNAVTVSFTIASTETDDALETLNKSTRIK